MSFLKDSKSWILITGGGSGIGLALAKKLINLGHEVIAVGRTQAKLDSAREKCPRLITFTADVGNEEGRKALVSRILSDYPQVNVLINNAAVEHHGCPPLAEVEPKHWAGMMEELNTNIVGYLELTVLFLPHLTKKPKAAIINVSSVVAFKPHTRSPTYCLTKAAVHSLTTSLREQLRDGPVSVVEIVPPLVNTEMPPAEIRDQGINSDVFVHSVITQILARSEEVFFRPDDVLSGSNEDVAKFLDQTTNKLEASSK